ncbi:MAG: hypothetical protein M3N14_09585 [Bacteroidota bacterium]|nr:hypothetical protein [Bacteroidota bacterium]
MRYLILISSLLITAYGFPNRAPNDKFHNHSSNIDTSKYAMFKLEDYPSAFDKGDKPAILSKEDMDQVEDIIDKEIAKINKAFKKSQHTKFNYVGNPQKYYKQVIPVINIKGEKVVWVNCLCTVSNEHDWKTRLIGILDGGSCYFNCKVNLNKNKLFALIVNGVD